MAFDKTSSGRPASMQRPMDVAKYAERTIDSYEDNKKYMSAEDSRRVTMAAVSAVQRDESGLKGPEAKRFENSVFKVAQATLGNYADRIEEGYPTREARSMAVRAVAGYYNERAEPKQAYGTLDPKEFASRTIDEYRHRAAIDGAAPARQRSTRIAAENVAAGNGVNVVRAGKLADASVNGYDARVKQGMDPDRARDETAREMGKRFDQHANDRDRRTARSRDGLSL